MDPTVGGFRLRDTIGGGLRLARSPLRTFAILVLSPALYGAWVLSVLGWPATVREAIDGLASRWSAGGGGRWSLALTLVVLLWPLWSLRRALPGRAVDFEPYAKVVRRGRRDLAAFDDIETVRSRLVDDRHEVYELSLVLRSGATIPLARSRDRPAVVAAVRRIASFVGVRETLT